MATRTVIERTTGPVGTVPHTQCVAAPSPRRINCPKCEKTFLDSVVVTCGFRTDNQKMDDIFIPASEYYVWEKQEWLPRAFYCDHCNHIVSWMEYYDKENKRLTGRVMGFRPRTIKKPNIISTFLQLFPNAAGVEQR